MAAIADAAATVVVAAAAAAAVGAITSEMRQRRKAFFRKMRSTMRRYFSFMGPMLGDCWKNSGPMLSIIFHEADDGCRAYVRQITTKFECVKRKGMKSEEAEAQKILIVIGVVSIAKMLRSVRNCRRASMNSEM